MRSRGGHDGDDRRRALSASIVTVPTAVLTILVSCAAKFLACGAVLVCNYVMA